MVDEDAGYGWWYGRRRPADGETYRYDRIGRLRGATYKTHDGTSWSGAADEGYSSAYRYDGNGNIMGIERWTLDGSGATAKMDDQTHHLTANTNQLVRVEETAPVQATEVVAGYDDVKHQATTTYSYDVSGRMVSDASQSQAITYTSQDKVSTIAIGGTTTITRLYGPDGRNVLSTSTTGGSSKRTYQIYGGGIDPVAIVTQDGEGDPVVSEILIQGLGRVGVYTGDNAVAYGTTIPPPVGYEIYHRTVGRKLYELTDHIGNVRAVIGDVKVPLGSDAYGVQLRSVQNYYPYGMPRPNNVWSAGALTQAEPYRFGFQGMQRDGDVGNATTAPSTTPFRQYDARLGRWWSVDPLSAMTGKTYQALAGNPIAMVDPWGDVEYYAQSGQHLGGDGVNNGQHMVLLDAADIALVQDNTNSLRGFFGFFKRIFGGTTTTGLSEIRGRTLTLPEYSIRQHFAVLDRRMKQPTAGDPTGNFHEDGFFGVVDRNGQARNEDLVSGAPAVPGQIATINWSQLSNPQGLLDVVRTAIYVHGHPSGIKAVETSQSIAQRAVNPNAQALYGLLGSEEFPSPIDVASIPQMQLSMPSVDPTTLFAVYAPAILPQDRSVPTPDGRTVVVNPSRRTNDMIYFYDQTSSLNNNFHYASFPLDVLLSLPPEPQFAGPPVPAALNGRGLNVWVSSGCRMNTTIYLVRTRRQCVMLG